MDNGSQHSLALYRLPMGGYVVQDTYQPGGFTCQHFACTTIDEALKFMRDAILPIPPRAPVSAPGSDANE